MTDHRVSRREILKYTGGAVGTATFAGSAAGDGVIEVNVGYSKKTGRRAARNAAAEVKREFTFRALTIRVARQAADNLSRRDDVRYVEENGEMEALAQTVPWGIEKVDAGLAIDEGNTGDGVDVAVIDTGIGAQHEDLQANLGTGKAFGDAGCDTSCGGPFCSSNGIDTCYEAWDDDNNHGTHVAGTVGAIDNSTGVLGVGPDVTLHAAKVLDCCGSGSYDDIAAGIEWSADQGHDVQNMSLGGDDSSVVQDAVQYAAGKNVVIVAAAGNDGPCTDCVSYPAAYQEVIAVSATDQNDDLADFSSTGPEVELAAPGVDVLSSIPRDDYDYYDGTSMASPHVAGGAAQVVADGTTDRQEVRQTLKDAADDVGLADNEQGAGRLNVYDALALSDGFSVATDDPTDVTDSSATLNGTLHDLDGADSADVYFEWGPAGDLSNTTATQTLSATGSFSEELTGLDSSTEYEFRAVGEASDGDSDTGATVAFTTEGDCVDATKWPDGTGYDGYEYIEQLDMDGQVVEASSDAAYYDFTCPDTVSVQQGGSFEVAMDFEDAGYDSHYANIFVDWDGNEDWSTATETVLMENVDDDTVTATTTVDVPSDAELGNTLVRVRLSWSEFKAPDATDEYGEVNDFTVSVE